jgi:NADH:ubiquinone oxidoreductase subunit 5 (subunit L)/multisubunit Na+/H+ antiporter MnhA subunit
MVTAGVFLIIRCSPLFESAPEALRGLTIIGTITAFYGATASLGQNDVKKIIAYSTSSQLGYMVFACGLSNYTSSLYHLLNHAFFKAALFLSAGSLIHNFKNSQDIREMGNLTTLMPFNFFSISIASIALSGFPCFSGAYSKDLILDFAYINALHGSRLTYVFAIAAAFCTASYSVRLLILIFMSQSKYNEEGSKALSPRRLPRSDTDNIIIVPLTVLIFGTVFSGDFFEPLFSITSFTHFKHAVVTIVNNVQQALYECLAPVLK